MSIENIRLNRVYFKERSRQSSTEKYEHLAYTTTWPTTNLLPELLLIVQTRSPCRIISIERKMEERNNIIEKLNIRKISVEDEINMEERNNILERLKGPWSLNGWHLKDASDHLKRDSEIVMAAVKQNGNALEFASEDLQKDREIVMAAVKQNGWVLKDASEDLRRDREIVMAAVKQNGYVLQFASEDLKRDREGAPIDVPRSEERRVRQ